MAHTEGSTGSMPEPIRAENDTSRPSPNAKPSGATKTSRPRVLVADFISEPLTIERQLLGDLADVEAIEAMSNADLDHRIESAVAVMVYHFVSIDREIIERMPALQLIVRCGVGYDNVDREFARSRGIDVTNVPDYGVEDVADAAIALVLSITRGTHYLDQRGKRGIGNWSYHDTVPLRRNRGRTFGILGAGRIGLATALRAKALGFEVIFYDPHIDDGIDKVMGIGRVESLEELMRQSHVLSCHCPLTDETFHIIDDAAIALMPEESVIINTARGGVVDVMAVLRGIESGKLQGAGIDVLEKEPPDPDHPLILAWRDPQHPAHDRLILTPHSAFYCEEGLADMRTRGSQNVRRLLLGEPRRNVVN
jgi:C-terminal binding protein